MPVGRRARPVRRPPAGEAYGARYAQGRGPWVLVLPQTLLSQCPLGPLRSEGRLLSGPGGRDLQGDSSARGALGLKLWGPP